ncbi:hypothetical protein NCAS_0E02210 [Naumovozyma castellii]|uniref:Uncharacterized protein n=1 Tax=Naumovozyma castellii TaxID=27288 RepID=G0VFM4_NAUCA|nr:hypothetical protein NCAS_0E02210 [Naumovozyma castellii CBS 4309]CCC70291.1 hypothetical protein NCAS_0E02210 [Naumovozyma castellii CBS 4309]
MSEPLTPLHPSADEQLDLNDIKELDDDDINDLDLNPDLDADIVLSMEDANKTRQGSITKRPINITEDDEIFDDMDDFMPKINVGSPFSSNVALNKMHAASTSSPMMKMTPRRLSMSQQSKFITYCDNQLMQVQRRFVQSQGLNNQNGYPDLVSLLKDLKTLVDFIWYSIDNSNPHTDYLLKMDTPEESTYKPSVELISTYFGQTSYLIRIADDLLDYIEKFKIKDLETKEQNNTVTKIFKFLFILDKIFIRLLTGTIPGGHRMNGTDAVRLCGIAERTRMRFPIYLESQNVHGYHYEVSKIYEETLDKCGN